MKMFVNDLILIACVKPTEMRTCEKILTTSGYTIEIKFTSNPYIRIQPTFSTNQISRSDQLSATLNY